MVAQAKLSYDRPDKQQLVNEVHAFLLSKASSRGRLRLNQEKMALEFGMEKTKFHRIVAVLVADGRLRVISSDRFGALVIVNPAPTSL